MGITVGTKTYVICDKENCNNRSESMYDQTDARDAAVKKGWFISQITGFSVCPECRASNED